MTTFIRNNLAGLDITQSLSDGFLSVWAREILHSEGLIFDSRSLALELFLDAVPGHFGDAMTRNTVFPEVVASKVL